MMGGDITPSPGPSWALLFKQDDCGMPNTRHEYQHVQLRHESKHITQEQNDMNMNNVQVRCTRYNLKT